MRIRPATRSDCPAVLEVVLSTPVSYELSWWLNTVESFETKLASGKGFIAEASGRIVDCVAHVVSDTDPILCGLAMRPEFRNQGIGTALMEAAETKTRARDLPRVLLAINASNLGVYDYYLRLGYVVSEEPYMHAVPGCPAPIAFTKEL